MRIEPIVRQDGFGSEIAILEIRKQRNWNEEKSQNDPMTTRPKSGNPCAGTVAVLMSSETVCGGEIPGLRFTLEMARGAIPKWVPSRDI
jgi:hypothetical protein